MIDRIGETMGRRFQGECAYALQIALLWLYHPPVYRGNQR